MLLLIISSCTYDSRTYVGVGCAKATELALLSYIRAPDHHENGEFGLENQDQLIPHDSSNSQQRQRLNRYDDRGTLEDCGKGNDNEDEHGDKAGYTNDSDAGYQEIQSFDITAATEDNLGQQQGEHTVLDSSNNNAGHQEIQGARTTAAIRDNLGQQGEYTVLDSSNNNAGYQEIQSFDTTATTRNELGEKEHKAVLSITQKIKGGLKRTSSADEKNIENTVTFNQHQGEPHELERSLNARFSSKECEINDRSLFFEMELWRRSSAIVAGAKATAWKHSFLAACIRNVRTIAFQGDEDLDQLHANRYKINRWTTAAIMVNSIVSGLWQVKSWGEKAFLVYEALASKNRLPLNVRYLTANRSEFSILGSVFLFDQFSTENHSRCG
jgi:hypothetical protein